MTRSLPPNPSLENLKKQAKTLQKTWQSGDAEALSRIRAAHPQYASATDEHLRTLKPRLTDCQLVLAREFGFDNWRQLRVAVEAANKELADQFVSLACLCHDDPHYDHRSFHARAHELLQNNPALAESNIWAATTAGNAAAVQAFLNLDPDLVNRPGLYGWAPLICACYSRVEPLDASHSTFEVAKLLLERGADPNAYTMKGNADERLEQTPRRFTALTGVFGGGSTGLANQPPHPRWRELAELLLKHGADPADEQALWINQGASLELLLRYGLKPSAPARMKMDNASGKATLMGRALWRAANDGNIEHVRLLLKNNVRTDEALDSETPWERAMTKGHLEIARMLKDAGARTTELNDVSQFVSLCMAGEERAAHTMLERVPDIFERSPKNLVQRAVGTKRKEAVKLVLDLGFDPNWIEDNGPIHMAGTLADSEKILRLLLQGGASLTLRDPWYDSTGIGWANFFDYIELRDRLLEEDAISIFDALEFSRFDRIPGILAHDPAALERPFAQCLSREPSPGDWQTPLTRMVDQGKTDAVRVLLELGADATARHPDGRSLLRLAHDKGFEEIAGLLE